MTDNIKTVIDQLANSQQTVCCCRRGSDTISASRRNTPSNWKGPRIAPLA